MSLSFYFFDKCAQKIQENFGLVQQKLADPGSWVTFEASGALVNAAKGGMGGLSSFASDYVEKNADLLLIEALQASGLEDEAQSVFNLVNNILAAALMANNEVAMFFIKRVAENCIVELKKKEEILLNLLEKVIILHNYLVILTGGTNFFDGYLAKLRSALASVRGARTDFQLVRSTFQRSNFWLGRRFTDGKDKLQRAKDLITPIDNNPAFVKAKEGAERVKTAVKAKNEAEAKKGLNDIWDGTRMLAAGILPGVAIPTTDEQEHAAVAIPAISREILDLTSGYFESTGKVNQLLSSYKSAVDAIKASLPEFFKKYILSLLDKLLIRVDSLVASMALILNGAEGATTPVKGFKPNVLQISTSAFKWIMDINLIFESFKTIPEGQLNAIALDHTAVAVYQSTVTELKKMNTISANGGVLSASEAEETMAALEQQILILLLEANNAIVSASVRQEVLGVSTAILSRLTLTLQRDAHIARTLQRFIDTPLPAEGVVANIGNSLVQVLSDAGMDNALDALNNGKFNKFFKLNPKEATKVGSGLAAIALLKQCLTDDNNRDALFQIEQELERDADLFNIKFAIDFDLAIFRNLKDCLRLESLGAKFNLKEILCKMVNNSGLGQSLQKLNDLLKF